MFFFLKSRSFVRKKFLSDNGKLLKSIFYLIHSLCVLGDFLGRSICSIYLSSSKTIIYKDSLFLDVVGRK